MAKCKVAVLMGGKSSEHEVSLMTGRNVIKNLDTSKYIIIPVVINRTNKWTVEEKIFPPEQVLDGVNVAFNAMHGQYGEDGSVQGVLEFFGIPYTGSGVLASALAMDKSKSRSLFILNGLTTPSNTILKKKTWYERPDIIKSIAEDFKIPGVVKPSSLGSSVGVAIINSKEEFEQAVNNAFEHAQELLLEEYIRGKEVTCGVLECFQRQELAALPVTEIIPPKGHFFDYEVKYNGKTKEITPAKIDDRLAKKIQKTAVTAHQILGCRGYSRTDMIVANDKIYVLETNTLPGFTEASLFPQAAQVAGLEFPKLLEHLINLASLQHK